MVPSPQCGRGTGRGGDQSSCFPEQSAMIIWRTPWILEKTSLSHMCNTRKPCSSSHKSRILSFSRLIACCPPSSSITSFFSKQTKSIIYIPIGCCRLNFKPINLFARRYFQRSFSASVDLFLRFFASWTCISPFPPLPFPLPLWGEGTLDTLGKNSFFITKRPWAQIRTLVPDEPIFVQRPL